MEISPEEVYDPINTQVYELERDAGYPRIVVGESLLKYLDRLERNCSNDLAAKDTTKNIQNCRDLITTDYTRKIILDPMGEGVKSVPGGVSTDWIRSAYEFVLSQEEFFRKTSRKKAQYYSDIRKYCESRLYLWGLRLIQK